MYITSRFVDTAVGLAVRLSMCLLTFGSQFCRPVALCQLWPTCCCCCCYHL